MVLAWKNLWRFLWCWSSLCCCCCSSFVVFLRSNFLFDILPQPSVNYRHIFRTILYFQPSLSQGHSRHFHFSTIPLPSYRERYGFERTFFTHRRFFTLRSFPIFWHSCFYQDFPMSQQLVLNVTGLPRPGPSVCLFHSNPQSSIHLSFVFIHIKIAKVLLMVQTLIRSAATIFSNHENLKQQSN